MFTDQRRDSIVQIATAVPSVLAVLVTDVMALPVEKWLALCGIGFIALQGVYLLWRWRRDLRRERERIAAGTPPPVTDRGEL